MILNWIMAIKTVQNWIVNGCLTGVRHLPEQVRQPARSEQLINVIFDHCFNCILIFLPSFLGSERNDVLPGDFGTSMFSGFC